MNLIPGSTFTIYRQIGDHTDSQRDSYTVVATIRNATDSTLLETLILENKTNGEYKKN